MALNVTDPEPKIQMEASYMVDFYFKLFFFPWQLPVICAGVPQIRLIRTARMFIKIQVSAPPDLINSESLRWGHRISWFSLPVTYGDRGSRLWHTQPSLNNAFIVSEFQTISPGGKEGGSCSGHPSDFFRVRRIKNIYVLRSTRIITRHEKKISANPVFLLMTAFSAG